MCAKCGVRDLAELWEFGVRLHPRRVLAYVTWMAAKLGQLPPPDLQGPDIIGSLKGTSNAANLNRIFVDEALKRDFVVGYALPSFASKTKDPHSAAGFPIIYKRCSKKLPFWLYLPSVSRCLLEIAATSTRAGMGHPSPNTRTSASLITLGS